MSIVLINDINSKKRRVNAINVINAKIFKIKNHLIGVA